jgi:hypothetical protein
MAAYAGGENEVPVLPDAGNVLVPGDLADACNGYAKCHEASL